MPVLPQDVRAGSRPVVRLEELAQRTGALISRVVLALVLAAISVLIPGEAGRFQETLLNWSDLSARVPFPEREEAPATAGASSAI